VRLCSSALILSSLTLSRSVARVLLVAASLSHCLLLLDLPRPCRPFIAIITTKPNHQVSTSSSSTAHNPQEEEEEEHHHVPRLSRSLALSDSTQVEPTLKKDTTHRHSQRKRERERAHLPLPIKRIDRSETLDARSNTNTQPHDLTHKHKERTKERERAHRHSQRPLRCHSHVHTHTHTHTHKERERESEVTRRRPPSRSDMPALLR